MQITQKLGDALLLALNAPGHRLTRCSQGFRPAGQFGDPVVTRRTANSLTNAGLGTYNDRMVPSAMTLTDKGIAVAREHAAGTARAAA